jgi:hypothetical protein
MGRYFNDAYAFIEINDIGQQVADSLAMDYDYENILGTVAGKKKIGGVTKKNITIMTTMSGAERGVRTTKQVKRLGCSLMKTLVETHKIVIEDYNLISELSTFINKKESYEADDGYNDDLVMCLVLFSWMTNQTFFADLCNVNFREKLYKEQLESLEESMLPLPLVNYELNNPQIIEDGAVWDVIEVGGSSF